MLYRALSLATPEQYAPEDAFLEDEEEEAEDEVPEPRDSLARWLVPAVVSALLLLGVLFYFVRPGRNARHGDAGAEQARGPSASSVSGAASCAPPSPGTVSRSGLEERSRWAHNLLDQKLYEAALPEIREIARLDPSYPGIHLDESDALLNLKRPDEARAAVDEQISMSKCLAGLAPPVLQAYCGLHYPAAPLSGCQAQIAHIRQQAELQAALVHLELGHRAQPGDGEDDVSADRPRAVHKTSHKRRVS